MDHTPFINAIQADPESLTPRLIYADWLEEHGDPRGAFIRACHAMETEDPWTDRYRELKSTRETLRNAIDSDWISQLGYDPVYRPLLSKLPRDYESRLRLLEEFTSFWCRAPAGARYTEEDIQDAENRLGHRLPAAYRQWFLRVKTRRSWLWFEEVDQLETIESKYLLVYFDGFASYTHLNVSLETDDPPLFDLTSGIREHWKVESRLTTFLLKTMLSSMLVGDEIHQFDFALGEALLNDLRAAVNKCDLDGTYIYEDREFFEAPNLFGSISGSGSDGIREIEMYVKDERALDIFPPSLRDAFGFLG